VAFASAWLACGAATRLRALQNSVRGFLLHVAGGPEISGPFEENR